jgi:hypothetical protein
MLVKVAVLVVSIASSSAMCLLRAYSVEPASAQQSGKVRGDENHPVSQIVTCSWDELDSASGAYVELFAGTMAGGGAYHVSVRTYPGGVPIASGNADGDIDHKWTKFHLSVDYPESLQRGHKLEFRFTRTDDSLHFYYQTGDPYSNQFGWMVLGGEQPPPAPGADLCMRVCARARVGQEFSVHSNIAFHNALWDSTNWEGCIASEQSNGVKFDKLGFAMGWPHTQPNGPAEWNWGWLDYLMG